jgi:hypothetical protein
MISNFNLATQQTMVECREHLFLKYKIKPNSLDQTRSGKQPRASPWSRKCKLEKSRYAHKQNRLIYSIKRRWKTFKFF